MTIESPRQLTFEEGLRLYRLHLIGQRDRIEAEIRAHGGTHLNGSSDRYTADIQAIERIQRRVFGEVGKR